MIEFIKTDDKCVIETVLGDSTNPNIPIFFDGNGIITTISEYLTYKSIDCTDVDGSVETYSYYIQKFLKYISNESNNKKELKWNKVTDRHLVQWRTSMEDEGLTDNYIINCLSTVFKFYAWAEKEKKLLNHVAIHDDSEMTYAISAVKNKKSNTWSWPHYPKAGTSAKYTPTNDEMEKIHTAALDLSSSVGLRDSILMTIYERTARRFEALQIKIDDIPDWDEIEEGLAEDRIFTVKVIGKRKYIRDIEFLPETMEAIREYIESDRQEIVNRIKQGDPNYTDPRYLFIGNDSGLPLNKQYLSRRISKIIKSTGIKDASGHRVRAKGLTDIVAGYDGHDSKGNLLDGKDVLIRAANKAGQKNTESLRPYLANSRAPGSSSKIANIERLRAIDNKLKYTKSSLDKIEALKPLYTAYEEGNIQKTEDELIKLLENIVS